MRRLSALAFAAILALSVAAPATAKDHPSGGLDMFSATVDAATAGRLAKAGYDIADQQTQADGKVRLSLVLSGKDRSRLRADGVTTTAIRDKQGRTARQRAALQAASGLNVWRSWDEKGGIRDELYDIAKKNAGFVKLEVLGHTAQGREIIALKVTQGAKGQKDGSRPASLFMSNQHAREWISVEVNRRLLRWILDQRKLENPEIIEPAQDDRAVVHHLGQSGRLPVHLRPRAAVAEEPPRQQRRWADRGGRRRRPQPQLRRALELRQRGLVDQRVQRDVPWPIPSVRGRDEGGRRA